MSPLAPKDPHNTSPAIEESSVAARRQLLAMGRAQPAARSALRRGEERAAAFFLAPGLFGVLAFIAFPVVFSFAISLTRWDIIGQPEFVGVANYLNLLGDAQFHQYLRNTFIYAGSVVSLGIIIPFALALALNMPLRGRNVFHTVYFLPVAVSFVATGLIWRWMFDPALGLINYSLGLIHVPGPDWSLDPLWAWVSLIIVATWKSLGYNMVIFRAALHGIPTELYEAAAIDGAAGWARFRYITVPLVTPALFFVLVTSLIFSLQVFDPIYIMTRGGPARATTSLVYYLFENGFQWFKMGYAATIAWVLFGVILVITLVQWLVARRWVFYE